MKRCFGYVRVSTVKQGDGVSLAAQKEAIEAFASRHSIEIVQWFEEKETAAKRGRPLFNQMVKELRRGKAHGLVIHKIDRSARNFADWAKIGDLQDAGIDIHFATESLDFRSRGGRLTYRGIHERLISPNLFERVQAIKSGKSGPKITRHDHTYRGLFHCGHCDGPMVPELQKGHVYYRCTKKGCPTKTIREEILAGAIEACLLKTQLSVPNMTDFAARLEVWVASDEGQQQEKAWALRRANLQDRIDRLTDALIDRLIDRDTFAGRRQRFALEEEALHQEREEWGDRAEKAAHMRSLIELANSLVSNHQLADSAEKRQLVEMTTSNRRVFGKEVYLEPSDWLDEVENTPGVLSGAPDKDTHRRGADMT